MMSGFAPQHDPAASTAAAAPAASAATDVCEDAFRAGVAACLRSWSALKTAVEGGWGGSESIEKAEFLRDHLINYFASNNSGGSPDELEDHLAVYMEEEFSVVLEDGSERQIADVVWRLYGQCARERRTALAEQLVQSAETAAATLAMALQKTNPQLPLSGPVIQSSEFDDDDDDDTDEDMMLVDVDGDNKMESAAAAAAHVPAGDPTAPSSAAVASATQPFTSFAEYASQPLFGPPKKKSFGNSSAPVRQLGEKAPIAEEEAGPEVDQDGFAPVAKKGSRRR